MTADFLALPIVFDVLDSTARIPGREIGPSMLQVNKVTARLQGEAALSLFVGSMGDRRPIDVAFSGETGIQAVDLISLKVGVKEFEPDRLYMLNPPAAGEEWGANWQAVTRGGVPHYRTILYFDPDLMKRILANYEGLDDTFVDLLFEIEATFAFSSESAVAYPPTTGELVAGETLALSSAVEVPIADGETKDFTLVGGADYGSIHPLNYSVSGVNTNYQTFRRGHIVQVTRAAGVLSVVSSTGWPQTIPAAQAPNNMALKPVWANEARLLAVTAAGSNTLIFSAELDGEAFTHSQFTLPASPWMAEVTIPGQTWEYYRDDGTARGTRIQPAGGSTHQTTMELVTAGGGLVPVFVIYGADFSTGPLLSRRIATAAGDVYLMGPRTTSGSPSATDRNRFTILFPEGEPAAVAVRITVITSGVSSTNVAEYPILQKAVGSTSPFALNVALLDGGEEEEGEAPDPFRMSTQTIVLRMRRDLIPDPIPSVGSGS